MMKRKNLGETWVAGKGDVRYWQRRIRQRRPNSFYSVTLQHRGRQIELSLYTQNQMEGANRAREYYFFLVANGWTEFLKKYRPGPEIPKPETLTVGQFLDAVRQQSELSPRTIENYAKRLRQIAGEIAKIKTGRGPTWLDRVHAVRLVALTPENIRAWKRTYLDAAGKNEIRRRARSVSCNSVLRMAKALFSRKIVLDKLSVKLPEPLPFSGITIETCANKFWGAGVDPRALLRDAMAELEAEELKAFILALALGLRRKEVDTLEWSSFDFIAGTLRIQPTEFYSLKTNESSATLPIEREFLELFRGWRARAKSEFVIESNRLPRAVDHQWYRCQEVFDSLLSWLRSKGIKAHTPFHTLRKMFGSEMCNRHGIHAASSALRHSNLKTTAEHYVDRRVRLTAGFGSELSGAAVLPFPPVDAESSSHRPLAIDPVPARS